MRLTPCYLNFLQCCLINVNRQLVLPESLEKHGCIDYVGFVKHLLEESLELQYRLLIHLDHRFIRQVLQFGTSKINDCYHLVYTFFVDKLLAVWEFDSPSMLQFFHEKVDQLVY